MNKAEDKIKMECLSALATARMSIRKNFPYYSTIIYGLIPRMAPGYGTLGVTPGMVLIVDPTWYVGMENEIDDAVKGLERKRMADDMRAGVLIHEAHHILRGLERIESLVAAGEDRGIVNKMFDIPINDSLKKSNVPLPSWVIYSSTYKFPEGLTGEQYLELFKKSPSAQKEEKSQRNNKKVGAGNCGGCAGNPTDGEVEKAFDEAVGRSSVDKSRIRRGALKELQDAVKSGACGNMPAGLEETLGKGDEKAMVPWEAKCRHIIRASAGRIISGRSDFSYRRPSRRSWTRGIIRPGMVDRNPEIMLMEDSSASQSETQLRQGRAEMVKVFKSLGIDEAWFCDVDAQVAMAPKRVRVTDINKLPVHGRGGTDFRPGIALAQTLKPRPELLIYFTDGDGTAPEKAPKNMEVIWCIVPSAHGRKPANWGHLVLVSNDQVLREPYNW
jgi:predicted metal-dependent peptidase